MLGGLGGLDKIFGGIGKIGVIGCQDRGDGGSRHPRISVTPTDSRELTQTLITYRLMSHKLPMTHGIPCPPHRW